MRSGDEPTKEEEGEDEDDEEEEEKERGDDCGTSGSVLFRAGICARREV